MKYTIKFTGEFKSDLKNLKKRGINVEKILDVVARLAEGDVLEAKYRDHALVGRSPSCRECHVANDLLLIYSKRDDVLILTCLEAGTHSDLFR